MERWEAYENEWRLAPTVDDLAAAYLSYTPPPKPGEKIKTVEDAGAMGPADFAKWVKQTKGGKISHPRYRLIVFA